MKCELCGDQIEKKAYLNGKLVCQECFKSNKIIKRNTEDGKFKEVYIFDKQLNSWMYKK